MIITNENVNLEQFSYAVAIILLIASVISPIATAIINNMHQLAIKKLDMYEEAKRKTLSDFIKSCEDYMLCGNTVPTNICSAFYSSINRLYIYFNISKPSIFYDLEDTMKQLNIISSNHELTKIVQELSKQIKKQ